MAKTKGFRFGKGKRGTVDLRFDADHELHGLEITVNKRVPAGVVISASSGDMGEAIRLFAREVVAWNVEDESGNPVAPSVRSIGEHVGIDEMGEIIAAWSEVMTQPSTPLGQASNDGDTSEED